jgi:Putative restriction endonuclease
VFVAGKLLWYAVEGKPVIRTAPDVMVVIGRPKGDRGSYRQWEEGASAPQVVFEIRSRHDRFGKMLEKFRFYDRYGVEEYSIYYPGRGMLEGWRRGGDRLDEIPEMAGFVSPRLGIRFEPAAGPDNLEIIGPDGKRFRTYVEVIEQLETEQRRPEEQAQLAQTERDRADRLAARLRELGVEPD